MTVAINKQPHFFQRLVVKKWPWLLFCGFFFTYPLYRALNRELPPELPILSKVGDFSFMSDQGEVWGSTELKGRTYVASFFCMDCPGSKEQLKKLQKIQKRVKGLVTSIALVSFTTKPENDTVKKLYTLGRSLHNNPYVWKFLTSDQSNKQMNDFLSKNFAIDFSQNFHQKFVLIDEAGNIRAYYTDSKNDINKMMIDIGLLINRSRLKFKKQGQGA